MRKPTPEFQPYKNKGESLVIAANVTMPELLDHLAEGFDFYDQPPLYWMLAESGLIPNNFFIEDQEEIGLKKVIAALVVARSETTAPNWSPRRTNQATRQKAALKYINYGAYIYGHDFTRLNQVLLNIWQYLQSYPFLIQYLQDQIGFYSKYKPDGSFNPTAGSLPNQYVLPSYAAFSGSRIVLDTRLVGLVKQLPDYRAADVEVSLSKKQDPSEGIDMVGYQIIRFLSTSEDTKPEEK